MSKTGWIVTAAVAALVAGGGAMPAFASGEAPLTAPATTNVVKHQTTCPVMEGNKINKALYVDFEGKRLYVCCGYCVKQVTKDPAKWFTKVEAEGITLDKVQVNCPVTGDKIDKKVFADYEGKRVYFCCAACLEKFNLDAKAIVAKMEADGIVLDAAPAADPAKAKKLD